MGSGTVHDEAQEVAVEQVRSAPLLARVRAGLGWTVLDKWGSRVVSLLTLLVLSRLLGPAEFGVVAVATLFIELGPALLESGLGYHLVQVRVLNPAARASAFWVSALFGAIGCCALLLGAPLVGAVLGQPELVPLLRLLAPAFLLYSLASAPAAEMRRELHFRPLAVRNLCAALVASAVGITLALQGAGAYSLVGQQLAQAGVGLLVLLAARGGPPPLRLDLGELRSAWRSARSMLGVEVLTFVSRRGDQLLMSAVLSPRDIGLYVMASRIFSLVLESVTSVIAAVAFPAFSRLQDDPVRLRRAFLASVRACAFITFPVFVLISCSSSVLIAAVLGETWAPTAGLLAVLALSGLPSVSGFDRGLLVALGRTDVELRMTLCVAALQLVAVAAAVGHGVTAVAVAVTVRAALTWPVRVLVLHRVAGIDREYVRLLLPVLVSTLGCAVAALGALVLVRDLEPVVALVSTVGAGAAGYALCTSWINPGWREELALLRPSPARVAAEPADQDR